MPDEEKSWELLKLEDKLYSEGYSEREIDIILMNEEMKMKPNRHERLKSAVFSMGLGIIAAFSSCYLTPQCDDPEVERKADPQMYFEPLEYKR